MKKPIFIAFIFFQTLTSFAQITDALGNQHLLRSDGEVTIPFILKSSGNALVDAEFLRVIKEISMGVLRDQKIRL